MENTFKCKEKIITKNVIASWLDGEGSMSLQEINSVTIKVTKLILLHCKIE